VRSPLLGTSAALVFTVANLESGNSQVVDQQTVYNEFRLVSDLLALYSTRREQVAEWTPPHREVPPDVPETDRSERLAWLQSRQGKGFAVKDAARLIDPEQVKTAAVLARRATFSQTIDWYSEGESRIVEVDGVRVEVRYVVRNGRRCRIVINAAPVATFRSSEIGSVS
jgi:hypothetical protein